MKINKILENKTNIEKLYTLLGISIFIHYSLVILFSLLILFEIFKSERCKAMLTNKSLILVQLVLSGSIIMSLIYQNYYGLIAIPVLFCIIVGRYYDYEIKNNVFKIELFEMISKISVIPFFTTALEFLFTHKRSGYWFFANPNYLGSVMMMAALSNLYLWFEKKNKINLIIFIINCMTVMLTGSRSAIIALIVAIFVLLFQYIKKIYFAMAVVFLSGYTVGVIHGNLPFIRINSIVKYFWLRIDIIKMAVIIFEKTNFLFGHGNFYYYKFTNYVYPHTHNILIELLLSYGLIGTVILSYVFLEYIYTKFKENKKNTLYLTLLIGVAIHNLTDFTIFWIQTVMLFIIIFSVKGYDLKN